MILLPCIGLSVGGIRPTLAEVQIRAPPSPFGLLPESCSLFHAVFHPNRSSRYSVLLKAYRDGLLRRRRWDATGAISLRLPAEPQPGLPPPAGASLRRQRATVCHTRPRLPSRSGRQGPLNHRRRLRHHGQVTEQLQPVHE